MAGAPQNPNRTDLVLYDQVTTRTNSIPTADIINNSVDYLRKSVAYRESSAESVPETQDLSVYNLQPGALIRLNQDGTGLVSPDVAPAFADGGYSDIDEIFYSSIEEATIKHPQLSNLQSGTQVSIGTDSGFRYIGDSNGTAVNRATVFAGANYPFRLPLRIRGIVRAKDFRFYASYNDSFGRYVDGVSLGFRERSPFNGSNFYLLATGGYRITEAGNFAVAVGGQGDRIENIQNVLGANWQNLIVAFEITLVTTVDNNQTPTTRITGTLGRYSTAAAAFGDTRPGRAFACLDPDHPGYIGTVTQGGITRRNYNGRTGYITPGMWANRYYYSELLTGSIYNNINNFVLGDLPEVRIQTPEEAEGLENTGNI